MDRFRSNYYQYKGRYAFALFVLSALMFLFIEDIKFVKFLEVFAFSIFAVVLLDWFADITTKNELFDKVFKYFNSHQENMEMGFEKVALDANSINYKKLIETSKKRIIISQITGKSWLIEHQKQLVSKVQQEEIELTFILMDGTNPAVESLANLFTKGDKQKLQEKMGEVYELCIDIKKYAKNAEKVNILQIKKSPMFGAVYMFDDTAIQIPVTTNTSVYESFLSYEFTKTSNALKKSAYDILENQINGLKEIG